jgi:hypothetical protein
MVRARPAQSMFVCFGAGVLVGLAAMMLFRDSD